MRYLPIFTISLFFAFFLAASPTAVLLANDPVKEAKSWADKAEAEQKKADEAAAKLDCDKPRSSDKNNLVKAIKDAKSAAQNAQKWAGEAQKTAESATSTANLRPKDKRAQEAKAEADKVAKDAQAEADRAKAAYEKALGNSEAMKTAAALEGALDKFDVSGNSQKAKYRDRLKNAAKTAAEADPCRDPEEVKAAVRAEMEKIKKEAARNSELKPWVDDLNQKLKDQTLISLPAPNTGEALIFTATGTGRTTGHIADLAIYNPGDRPVTVVMDACYIPSDGKYQPYIVPASGPVSVKPHSTANVSLQGYCADIFTRPVPLGAPMPPVQDWVTVATPDAAVTDDAVRPHTRHTEPHGAGWRPDTNHGWAPAASLLTVPGTDLPLGHTINARKHPEEAAAFLLDALSRIGKTYDQMQASGLIQTPFSGNPDKERESVIQQTFWQIAAALTGNAYKLDDFRANAHSQFAQGTGRDADDLPAAEQEQLEQGINLFWNTFEAVGAEAKVLHHPNG